MGEERTIKKVENGWVVIEPELGKRTVEPEELVYVFEKWDDLIQHLQDAHKKGEI